MNSFEIESLGLLIIIGVLLSTFFTLAIIAFVLFFQRKMMLKESELKIIKQEKELELIKVAMEVEENERKKIAQNLHDEVNPMLALLKFNQNRYRIEIAKNKFNPDSFNSDEKIIDHTIETLRTISMDLAPAFLIKKGLLTAIEDYLNQFRKSSLIKIKLLNNVDPYRLQVFSIDKQLEIYRIWLELFHNISKHSNCNKIEMTLSCDSSNFIISYLHDGVGISNETIHNLMNEGNRIGLKSVKSRSDKINAIVNYINNLKDPVINLTIPLSLLK